MLPAPGFGVVGPKSVQRLFRPGRRKIGVPAQPPKVEKKFVVDLPVVLKVAAEVIELLTDKAHSIDLPAVGVAKQERGEGITTRIGIGAARNAGFLIAEPHAARFTLTSEACVVIKLIHTAKLKGVPVVYPGEVVIVSVDSVLRTIVRLAAPRAVGVTGAPGEQVHQVLVASWGHCRGNTCSASCRCIPAEACDPESSCCRPRRNG